MDDPGARLPEPGAILRGGGSQKVVDLAILNNRFRQIRIRISAGLNQMVAMNCCWHSHAIQPGLHELQ